MCSRATDAPRALRHGSPHPDQTILLRPTRRALARGEGVMPRFGSVVFDCDSTLSAVEGIEELSADHREEVTRLTDAAMRGDVSLEEVYGRRLELVRPTRDQVAALGQRYVEALVPDAREVIAALRVEGIEVRIMSGGLRPAVVALATSIGVDASAVAAVDVYFDGDGRYTGFDAGSPLARSGGKRAVLERWAGELPRPVMVVGDGATDLEARPPADAFVAFAGVVERESVVRVADAVIRSRSLAPVLPLALGLEPPASTARGLYEKGIRLLGPDHRSILRREA